MALLAVSCSKEAGFSLSDAAPEFYKADVIVTIKQDADGTVFFQYGSDRLYPGAGYPFERQCRAMASVTIYAEEVPLYGHRVDVNWLEPIDQGAFKPYPAEGYGSDGIDILTKSWITSVEDGYVTLHYKTWWGDPSGHHDFFLVQGEDPYELTLMHNANGDEETVYSEGTIYFDINSLPPTGDGTETIHIKWNTIEGNEVIASFEFKSRK